MRLWKLGLVILVVALSLWGYIALPLYDVYQLKLTGLLRRKADVIAANPDGLYRATLASKRWVKLPTPPEMPLGGNFAGQPEDSSLIFYIAYQSGSGSAVTGLHKDGLYLSTDDGSTWTLVNDEYDFGEVLLLSNGTLFALTRSLIDNGPKKLLRSADQGKTSRDITGKLGPRGLSGLFPDPDHPGLVRLRMSSMRDYLVRADDENYDWKIEHVWLWIGGRPSPGSFFYRRFYSSDDSYISATLTNYFDHDFGSQPYSPSFEILPWKDSFEFRRGEPVAVPIRVAFHEYPQSDLAESIRRVPRGKRAPMPAPTMVTFVDQPGGTDFWGIRVERAGEQVESWPGYRWDGLTDERTSNTVLAAKLKAPGGASRISLATWLPYDRTIDLGKLSDFSRPGTYLVQLFYSSGDVSDPSKGEWKGLITGSVFRVMIKQ